MSVPTPDDFTNLWTQHRAYVVDLAFRMLGNIHDAEDVVQDAFGRLLAHDLDSIEDPRGWLVVVVSRLCLDQLRSARVRRETTANDAYTTLDALPAPPTVDPADRVTLDDSINMALLVVLQQLTPAERAVFVLHDLFQFSFDSISDIVGRTPAACRQLASRARRRIESETGPSRFNPETVDQDLVARRFIAACAGGNLAALLELLDADVVGDVDLGSAGPLRQPLHGNRIIARNLLNFYGPASDTTLVSQPINGQPGVLAFRNRELVGLLQLKDAHGKIHDIHAIADPAKLAFIGVQLQSIPG